MLITHSLLHRTATQPTFNPTPEVGAEDRFTPSSSSAPLYSQADLKQLFEKPKTDEVPTFTSAVVSWSARVPKGIGAPAGIGPEGNLYFQTEEGLAALDSKGQKLWTTPFEYLSRYASPVTDDQGTVYAVAGYRPGKPGLLALSPKDGSIQWEGDMDSFQESPILGPDNSLYAGDYSGNVVAFNPDRTERWRTKLDKHVNGKMGLGPKGELYLIGDPGHIHAFTPDGKPAWEKTEPHGNTAQIGTGVTVTPEGDLLVTTWNSHLFKLAPDGSTKWAFGGFTEKRFDQLSPEDQEDALHSGNMGLNNTAVLSGDAKTIYVGGDNGNLFALDQDGKVKWKAETGLHIENTGVQVGDDGTIYAACDRAGTIRAYSPEGNPLWRFNTRNGGKAFIATRDEMVYLATDRGEIHALSNQALLRMAERANEPKAPPTIEFEDGELVVGDFSLPLADY